MYLFFKTLLESFSCLVVSERFSPSSLIVPISLLDSEFQLFDLLLVCGRICLQLLDEEFGVFEVFLQSPLFKS